MKIFEKIKNYFYDEEVVEDPKKAVKSDVNVSRVKPVEEVKKDDVQANVDVVSERELFKSETTFNFPVIFDDDDFKDDSMIKKSSITRIKEEHTKVEERNEIRNFKPSPNISPIYGIIGENKESKNTSDNGDNLLNLYEENKKVDIDEVLGKVYSHSRVEINKENYEQPTIEEKPKSKTKNNSTNNLIDDFFNEDLKNIDTKIKPENSLEDVDTKLKSINELLDSTDDDDFYSLVDSMYKDDEKGDE